MMHSMPHNSKLGSLRSDLHALVKVCPVVASFLYLVLTYIVCTLVERTSRAGTTNCRPEKPSRISL